jgi:hypothetical protein
LICCFRKRNRSRGIIGAVRGFVRVARRAAERPADAEELTGVLEGAERLAGAGGLAGAGAGELAGAAELTGAEGLAGAGELAGVGGLAGAGGLARVAYEPNQAVSGEWTELIR